MMDFEIMMPVLIRTSSEPVKSNPIIDRQVNRSMDDLIVEYSQLLTFNSIQTSEIHNNTAHENTTANVIVNMSEVDCKIREAFENRVRFRVNSEEAKCAVCLTTFGADFTCMACVNEECSTQICHACLFEYVSTVIKDAQYTMPPIRCVGCKHRIPTPLWIICLQRTKTDMDAGTVEQKLNEIMDTCECIVNTTYLFCYYKRRYNQWLCLLYSAMCSL